MRTEQHTFRCASGRYEREVQLLIPDGKPRGLAIFLDAETYGRMPVAEVLDGSMAYALIAHHTSEARHWDYVCNPDYAAFVAEDVTPWAESVTGAKCELVAGLSLSGLAAAYLALKYPEKFPRALCQSGSFWWSDEWFAANAHALTQQPGKLWLSVGNLENGAGDNHAPTGLIQKVSQPDAVFRAADALSACGHSVQTHLFDGGHQVEPWKGELPAAMTWLFG